MTEDVTIRKAEPVKRPEDIARSNDFYLTVAALVGVLFFAAVVLLLLGRWRKRQERGDDPAEILTNYREMYEAGELSEEEYAKIRARMAEKIKDKPASGSKSLPPKSE